MLFKALVTTGALGVVSMWYLRSRAPFGLSRSPPPATARRSVAPLADDSPNEAERLQHSHAMGVAGGVELPTGDSAEDAGAATAGAADQTAWPGSRDFMRGA